MVSRSKLENKSAELKTQNPYLFPLPFNCRFHKSFGFINNSPHIAFALLIENAAYYSMFAEIVIEHRGKEKDRSSIRCGRIFQTVLAGYYHFKIDVQILFS
ncbi:hypothetical protein T05_1667 [Trichinella murrelli]|uniref:Uncharacterized protein n=1 Tax=Trichinella murrelli TaxID=144512 RepID=A0A0V0T9X4_9BILA|nr:hypothetical protein T05_1667 [Trichinella murrelli]